MFGGMAGVEEAEGCSLFFLADWRLGNGVIFPSLTSIAIWQARRYHDIESCTYYIHPL
jgi:hypothetical protein